MSKTLFGTIQNRPDDAKRQRQILYSSVRILSLTLSDTYNLRLLEDVHCWGTNAPKIAALFAPGGGSILAQYWTKKSKIVVHISHFHGPKMMAEQGPG